MLNNQQLVAVFVDVLLLDDWEWFMVTDDEKWFTVMVDDND